MAWNVIRKDPFAANEIKTKGAFIKYLFSFFSRVKDISYRIRQRFVFI